MAHYLISEASRKLNVEAHVLRYWEEELKLEIPRNELGHRYYTEKQLALFRRIKELKELGYQLKAIRTSLSEEQDREADEAGFLLEKDREAFTVLEGKASETAHVRPETEEKPQEEPEQETMEQSSSENGSVQELPASREEGGLLARPEKLEQFQAIMTDVLAEALKRNHENFSREMGGEISEKVVKEMNFLMKDREEREEERYRKLDETIRACQRVQKQKSEAAATRVPVGGIRKRRLGFRRKKEKK